ncbi:cupin-like domain-containing protein [Caulobacter sp. 1776]|uniref:cupin-like domain-containing protein n=1 Tax=Caulobacter sp. 1776 TaxID=3156420 RepID=UPI003398A87B
MIDAPSGLRIDDPAGFAATVSGPCKPVVLRGLCRRWPVVEAGAGGWAALSDYLARLDAGRAGQAFVGAPAIAGRYDYGDGPDGFNFERASLTLAQVLDRIGQAAADPSLPSVYMGSLPADDFAPRFADENPIDILPPLARPRLWVGNASRIACHYDSFDNLACVVAGRRRFTLYPPDAIGDLYVGPIDHTLAGQPISLAAGAAPDDPRYPRFAAAADRAIVVELEPGDALYLPKLWWHQVEALDPANLLVNYWWDAFAAGPDAPYVTMMLAMIAIAERPAAEREAWRAFFDHYVFRPGGHPLAHMPAERHGLLGPLADGNYGRIRAIAMKMLRGG